MKKKFCWIFVLCAFVPMFFVGCSNEQKYSLKSPNNLTVSTDGLISFEMVDGASYYEIAIGDNMTINVFPNETSNSNLVTRRDNILTYNASSIFVLGETYSVKVGAKASKKDSDYTNPVTYRHTVSVKNPSNLQINNTVLTWDAVEHASYYVVKVANPSDANKVLDDDAIMQLPSYQFSSNRFDFESILSMAGEYKFFVQAVSSSINYTQSKFVSKAYQYIIPLNKPTSLQLHSVKEFNNTTSEFKDHLHMTCVVDENANGIAVLVKDTNLVEYNAVIELNKEICTQNFVDLDLTYYMRAEQIDFAKLGQYIVKVKSIYISNDDVKYFRDSDYCKEAYYIKTEHYNRPQVAISNDDINTYATWQSEGKAPVGYTVYVVTKTQDDYSWDSYVYDTSVTKLALPQNLVAVTAKSNANGNMISSKLADFATIYEDELDVTITAQMHGKMFTWTEVEDAYYCVEFGDNIIFTNTNSLQIDEHYDEITLHIIKQGYKTIKQTYEFTYSVKLATPYVAFNQGFVNSNPYLLTFTGVNNAIGYYIYLNGEKIDTIFTTTSIDLKPYITKIGNYNVYRVQIQAVGNKYQGYVNSDLTTSALYTQNIRTLDSPNYLLDINNKPVPIKSKVVAGLVRYYLYFYRVEDAVSYDVMINWNKIEVSQDAGTSLYEIDVTDHMLGAGIYNISLQAIANENSNVIKSSEKNTAIFYLEKQLQEVTNIVVSSEYTLSFDFQDNTDTYRVRILKVGDDTYDLYLSELGLSNPFNIVQATDISEYLVKKGEYHIYVTAIAVKGSFYGDSNESSTYATVNKLNTLLKPTDVEYANVSEKEFNLRWQGDEHADYYLVKLTNPAQDIKEYKVYGSNIHNINEFITVEGKYAVKIRSMITPGSNNSKEYQSSMFSDEYSFVYTYTNKADFNRYKVFMYGDTYDFEINNVNQLMYQLWYHYLYGVDENYGLKLYFTPILVEETQKYETVDETITRLINEAEEIALYDFSNDEVWINENQTYTPSQKLKYLVNVLLKLYPELSILQGLEVNQVDTGVIFNLRFNNALEVDKNVAYPTSFANDYAVKFDYLSQYNRRKSMSTFTIDLKDEMSVSNSEQLLMAVQYGKKPKFTTEYIDAEIIYNNAKSVLLAIVSDKMTDTEKATRIFEWLQYAYNVNLVAKNKYNGANLVSADINEYGVRSEFYLESIFLGLNDTTKGYYDGEFYIKSDGATDESFAKAFVLLCGIEGITARKISGYRYEEQSSWNKVLLDPNGEGKKYWYALSIPDCDLYVNYDINVKQYNMSSHIYFMVTDAYLSNKLGLVENDILKINECNKSYDVYQNKTFSLTVDQITQTIKDPDKIKENDVVIAHPLTDITYSYKYDSGITYQRYGATNGVGTTRQNNLQNYMFNLMVLAKYRNENQKVQSNDGVSIEFEIKRGDLGPNTKISTLVDEALDMINNHYGWSVKENMSTTSLIVKLDENDVYKCVILLT